MKSTNHCCLTLHGRGCILPQSSKCCPSGYERATLSGFERPLLHPVGSPAGWRLVACESPCRLVILLCECMHALGDSLKHAYCGSGVLQCARDFVDYDANSLAVAAGVPGSIELANAVLARMDSGSCTCVACLQCRVLTGYSQVHMLAEQRMFRRFTTIHRIVLVATLETLPCRWEELRGRYVATRHFTHP